MMTGNTTAVAVDGGVCVCDMKYRRNIILF